MNEIDTAVIARLKAPFGCEFIPSTTADPRGGRWRIHDANDDAVASVSHLEEGYARLIVKSLNEHFARKGDVDEIKACPCQHTKPCHPRCTCVHPASSSGCRRCCTYGSPDQQAMKAEMLAEALSGSERLSAQNRETLQELVDERLPVGTADTVSEIMSRLIGDICQRDRFLGRLQEKYERAEQRAVQAENTVRSMRGNYDDARKGVNLTIKKACRGAKQADRKRLVTWLRATPVDVGGGVMLTDRECRPLANAIERLDYLKGESGDG